MDKKNLSQFISVKRRYNRSVNLERDIARSDSVLGYVVTAKALETLQRFVTGYKNFDINRAWTITGVYGTGKSAFAHFLTAICANKKNQIRINAIKILSETIGKKNQLYKDIVKHFPERGIVRAVSTAQNESISNAIIRALYNGARLFWEHKKPVFFEELEKEYKRVIHNKDYKSNSKTVLEFVEKVAIASKTGLLIIIDELGKNLEFAVRQQSVDDLYLLQQIAELPTNKKQPRILLFGILHQSFSDYAHGLVAEQRKEWTKIQGRFEDILFIESQEQLLRVIGIAIEHGLLSEEEILLISKWSRGWEKTLVDNGIMQSVTKENIASAYPLHPISSLVLPILCNKYAQNDRTLFTFLTSSENHAMPDFLKKHFLDKKNLPALQIHNIYDYFIEAITGTIWLRPEFQRWTEIQNRISEARHLDIDALAALKTIGVLNLIFISGPLRATRKLISLALSDDPKNKQEQVKWERIIDSLLDQGILIWRRQADELRVWEGSDFDIEKHIGEQIHSLNASVADLLNENYPLKHIVSQRHSYQTGTFRYFEQRFLDSYQDLENIECKLEDSDGIICYWIDKPRDVNKKIPSKTRGNKPIVFITSSKTKTLKIACCEYIALKNVEKNASQLYHDGVARREVRQRLSIAKNFLDNSITQVFDITKRYVTSYIFRKEELFNNQRQLNAKISDICDEIYKDGLSLKNELINRQQITTQGARARKLLIHAMLNGNGDERLGLSGHGPECSIFDSLLDKTGLYFFNPKSKKWIIKNPNKDSGTYEVWNAIEEFCLSATNDRKKISELYDILKNPPYGMKKSVLPILITAVLIKNADCLGLYKNGTFINTLTEDDFDLIEKKADLFSVKHFEIRGLRTKVFSELEKIFKQTASERAANKKITLLELVKPFIHFVRNLPAYTARTKNLSNEALAVKRAILEAQEPDHLIFSDLPKACGIEPIRLTDNVNDNRVKRLRKTLENALRELHMSYEELLDNCKKKLKDAFDVPVDGDIYHILQERARHLVDFCVESKLKNFVSVASDSNIEEGTWLKTLTMIIADKPSELWIDDDLIRFEFNLCDIARRFKDFEKLHEKVAELTDPDLFAMRITITKKKQDELNKMIWINKKNRVHVEKVVEDVLNSPAIKNKEELKLVLLSTLAEKILPHIK